MLVLKKSLTAAIPRVSRAFTHASITKDDEKQLVAFPEYQQAVEQQAKGNLTQALVALHRVHDVLSHALGADAALSNRILFQMAGLTRAQGEADKALKMVQDRRFQNVKDKVSAHIFSASTHLLQSKLTESVKAAQHAVDLCENQDHSDPDNTLFSSAYSSLGLATLYNGNVHAAETFLQMSARWATTPLEEVSALANIGSLVWFKLAAGLEVPKPFSIWQYDAAECSKDLKLSAKSTAAPLDFLAADGKEIDSHPLIVHTIGSWSEASKTAVEMDTAIAIATMLSNHASLMAAMGKHKECGDLLAEAVKVLSAYDHIAVQPITGVVLRKLAVMNMKVSQAVTAEGLFNAALTKLASPHAKHDVTFVYEAAITKASLGQLLTKWDKREAHGHALQKEAVEALGKLPKYPHDVLPSATMILPQP